ncbi:hypothetical protein RJ639_013424 [Escallonia herrerae]|uniref:Reverse transcriptase Ty1/copia-type domain-containing protein n=1 Tax=Escallonia herrerae TaxID=1293975 RepID=A0AA88VIF0_9ASTE|nr:hypothetical protein RJ639_013424 [Escallonia herrerae]
MHMVPRGRGSPAAAAPNNANGDVREEINTLMRHVEILTNALAQVESLTYDDDDSESDNTFIRIFKVLLAFNVQTFWLVSEAYYCALTVEKQQFRGGGCAGIKLARFVSEANCGAQDVQIEWQKLYEVVSIGADFLKGKGKLSHLLGTGPKKGDPRFDAWDEEDSMVMSWLWNSMLPEISDTFMFLPTCKEIWQAAQQTYSKVKDAARVFEIKSKISDTKQGDRSVTEYANLLKNLWQEMDHYRCIEMKCSDDAAVLKNFIEKDRTYDFLAGLNIEFDQMRIQILGKEELPSLNETISIINTEESRRGVMLYAQPVEESAMLGPRSEKLRSQVHMTQSREDMSHADVNSSGGEENGFNKEDIGRLRSLLDSLEKSKGGVMALIVYVDDIIVTRSDSDEKEALRKYLVKEFEIKDLGKLKYFLGIEVARSKEGIFVSQQKYVLDLLEETGKLGCRPSDTPIEPNHRLAEFMEGEPTDKGMYQRLVGKLINLSHTRPDIAYAVSVVSQFMQNPKDVHFHAVYQILQYLKGSPRRGILLYTDADYGGSLTDRRSTSGYCTFLGGNLVTWRSKKQLVVARSSSEAEFRSMAQGGAISSSDWIWGVRRLGAAAVDMCHVALGIVEAYWEYRLKPWDMAAGVLIVEEAGGTVSCMDGERFCVFDRSVLVSNGVLHAKVRPSITYCTLCLIMYPLTFNHCCDQIGLKLGVLESIHSYISVRTIRWFLLGVHLDQ